MRRAAVSAVVAGVCVLVTPTASASPAGMPDQPQVSNMGYCSAQLAQTDAVMGLAPTARAEVNQLIRLHGDTFGLDSPGQLYSVRARTPVAEDPVCQRR